MKNTIQNLFKPDRKQVSAFLKRTVFVLILMVSVLIITHTLVGCGATHPYDNEWIMKRGD